MESNTYFTYWIKRYGKEDFKNLTDKVIQNVAIPLDYQKGNKKDEYLFHYFFMVYLIIALDFLKLNIKQIEFIIDLAVTPAVSRLFPPSEVLEMQKENIPELLSYIKKDLEIYYKN